MGLYSLINVDSHRTLAGHTLDIEVLGTLKQFEGLAINHLYSNNQKHFAATAAAESISLLVSLLKFDQSKKIHI